MDYYGLLFLYYLKGLSGKSVLRLFFNIEAGGTEQLLPENTSTPTTTPILADIQYPDGLRTDQYFTYRETPTTVSNKARIKTIKGNTLVWNQIVEKGNMTDGWAFSNATGSYSNNILTFTATAKDGFARPDRPNYIYAGHKYFATVDVKATSAFTGRIYFTGHNEGFILGPSFTTSWKTFSLVFTNTVTQSNYFPRVFDTRDSGWDAVQIRNCMLIDLTQMGLDSITSVDEFVSLFPLPYYEYNQGSLLSFNGSGIKTVGFNQWDGNSENGKWIDDYTTGAVSTASSGYNVTDFIHVFPNTTYYHAETGSRRIMFYDGNKNPIPMTSWQYASVAETIVSPPNAHYIRFTITNDYLNNFCFNISDPSKNGTYVPYTESVLSLPISTYFPNGMKSAGSVYDELTESKAITRIGSVDLGTLDWAYNTTPVNYFAVTLGEKAYGLDNMVCSKYETSNALSIASQPDKTIRGGSTNRYLFIKDSSYTSAEAFKSAMSGVYLVYPLATPTETPITTEDANEALSLLMGKSVSSNNAKQMIDIITKGE